MPRIGTFTASPANLSAQAAQVNNLSTLASTSAAPPRRPVMAFSSLAKSSERADRFSAM